MGKLCQVKSIDNFFLNGIETYLWNRFKYVICQWVLHSVTMPLSGEILVVAKTNKHNTEEIFKNLDAIKMVKIIKKKLLNDWSEH